METILRKFFVGLWLILICLQTLVMFRYDLSLREAISDSLVTATILVVTSYAIVTITKYFRPSLKNALTVFVSALMLSVFCNVACFTILQFLAQNDTYIDWINSTLTIRFIFTLLVAVIAGLNGWLFFYFKEHQQDELRIKENEQLARETELAGLRQQLQPHFLFNSLNSISALTIAQPDQARKMIEQLSDFLRGTVKKDGKQMVSLEEELHHLQLYLDIEKVRFGHRLDTQVIADEKTLSMKLPSLLLQPLVENAIKFGLYDTVGEVIISIHSKAEANSLVIQITNPFDPSTTIPRSGTGFGLKSVQRRLALLFYRSDLLTTEQKENIFTTTVKIPQG